MTDKEKRLSKAAYDEYVQVNQREMRQLMEMAQTDEQVGIIESLPEMPDWSDLPEPIQWDWLSIAGAVLIAYSTIHGSRNES